MIFDAKKVCGDCRAFSGTDCVIPSPELGCPRDNIEGPLKEYILNAAAKEIAENEPIPAEEILDGPDMNYDLHQLVGYVWAEGNHNREMPTTHMCALIDFFLKKHRG